MSQCISKANALMCSMFICVFLRKIAIYDAFYGEIIQKK